MPIAQIIRQAETFRLLPNHEFYLAGTTQKATANRGRAAHGWTNAMSVLLTAIRYQHALKTECLAPSEKNQDRLYIPVL